MSYWDSAYEGAKEESGGGVIGRGRLDLGYFAFVSGFAGDDRLKCLFVPKNETKAARAAARKIAQEFAVENGGDRRSARWCTILRLYKNDCSSGGEQVGWSYDRLETIPLWTLSQDGPSAAKLMMERINQLGIPGGEDFWGQFTWTADPYKESLGEAGMTDTDQDGKTRFPRVCIPVRLFKDTAEARAAMGGEASSDSTSSSDAWDDDTWNALLPEMNDLVIGGASKKQVADDYGCSLPELISRLNSFVPM